MANASTAIAVADQVDHSVIAQQLGSQTKALVSLLGSELEARRHQRLALTAIAKNPGLLECTPDSVVLAVMDAAAQGLKHYGAGGAWLVPFRVNVGTKEHPRWESHAQMIPDYRAVVAMVTKKGSEVRVMEARVVKEGDAFDFGEGDTGTWVEHKPTLDPTRSQKVTTHIYTRAHLRAGGPALYHVIDRAAAEAVRARAKKKGFSPWDSDWDEMAKKTCAKAHSKWLPVPADVLEFFAREDALISAEPEPPVASPATTRAPRTAQLAARLQPVADDAEQEAGPPPAAPPAAAQDEDIVEGQAVELVEGTGPEPMSSEAFTTFLADWAARNNADLTFAESLAKKHAAAMFAGVKRLDDGQRARLAVRMDEEE